MRILKAVMMTGLLTLSFPALSFPVMAQDAPKANGKDPDAVRCKRLAVTGSLVRKERVCKTNSEWRAISEQQSRDADDLITRSRSGMNASGT